MVILCPLCAQLTSRKPALRAGKLSVCTTHIKEASNQRGKAVCVHNLHQGSQHSERESCLCAQLTSRKPAFRAGKLSVCTTHIKEASIPSGKAVCVHNSHQGSQQSERESCLCAQLTSRKPALRVGKLSVCTTHIKEASNQRGKAVCVHNSHQGSQHSEQESCLCAQLTSRKPAIREGKLSVCTTHIKEASNQSGKAVCVHNSHQGSQHSERESCPCAAQSLQCSAPATPLAPPTTACVAVQDGTTWEPSNACLNIRPVRQLAWLYKTASPGNKVMHA